MKKSTYSMVIICFCVAMMICSFFLTRNKRQIKEASALPFSNTKIEQVADGIYEAQTYTSFLHLQVKVTVKDHQLSNIELVENSGSKGQHLDQMVLRMIEQNKVVVELQKNDQLASVVLISCVDSAISQGKEE